MDVFENLSSGIHPNVYTSKLDSKPDFSFLFAYSCCFFFFFFLRNISLAVAFQISCVFFSSPILKKEPFSVRFFEGEKKKREKKRAKKIEILRHLRISFFFHSFFNKCVYFLYGCFERKILFLLREICNARIYNYYYTCIII